MSDQRVIQRYAVEELGVRYRSKKDGKRWCGGKVGKEHEVEWVQQSARWSILVCKRCGRKLDYDFSGLAVDLRKELKRLRKEQGITQEALASKAGMEANVLSTIENNPSYRQNEVRLSTWQKLFAVLGYDVVVGIQERQER